MASRSRLGEILVDAGLAPDDLNTALELQASTGERLGEILVGKGYVSPVALHRALATQAGIPFVDLEAEAIDWATAQSIPVALARRHTALPIAKDGTRLVVAMANPTDVFALDDIRAVTGLPVAPVLAEPGQLRDLLVRFADTGVEMADAIRLAVEETADAEAEALPSAALAEDAPIVRFVDLMLVKAVADRASDVHVEPGAGGLRIRFRIDGVLHEAMSAPMSLRAGIVSRLKVMAELDIAERRVPQDGRTSVSVGGRVVDLRIATLPTVHGEAVVLRVLDGGMSGIGLADCGFSADTLARFRDAYATGWGAVLVTGPTGSGKTTTLYAALGDLATPERNVLTIEDPVEYRLEGLKQVQVNNRAGLTFATALRSFLRSDPDVILVGEIRDRETARMAAEASLTGHLVLSSLHTTDAASTPLRLLEIGVEPFLVTSAVRAVLAQRLARRLCERCVEVSAPTEAELLGARWPAAEPVPEALPRAVGCSSCAGTGYRGRIGLHELLVMSDEVIRLVLASAPAADVVAAAVAEGMVPLRLDGLRKVAAGLTTLEELARVIG